MATTRLSALSNRELLSRLQTLVRKERSTTLDILLHLNEVERRNLFLELGYGSMFDYCTRHLKYSASAAGRRIQTARCLRQFPEVHALLSSGDVNLSTIALIAPVLRSDNKRILLEEIRNKSQREVDAVAARYRPPVQLRDRVRPVCVRVPNPIPPPSVSILGHCEKTNDSRSGSEKSTTYADAGGNGGGSNDHPAATRVLGVPETRLEERLLVQFLTTQAFMRKYDRARALLSNRLGKTSFESVFETLLDEFLGRYSPELRRKRREKRRKTNGRGAKRKATKPRTALLNSKPSRSRRIPASLRDQVFARDKGRCTYVGTTGRRCRATHNLQIDHILPFARGGPSTLSNLRLLCGRHNRMEAEKVMGTRRSSERSTEKKAG